VSPPKIKALRKKCFYFCVCVRKDTTSFDRLRSTSFFAKQKHHSALADTKRCYTLRCKRCDASHQRCCDFVANTRYA